MNSVSKNLQFYVPGRPQPRPRKKSAGPNRFGGVHNHDPKGRKRAWAQNVRLHAQSFMKNFNHDMIIGPCRLGVEFRFNRPKSNKDDYPTNSVYPDWSNMWYFIENIIKECVYLDDKQVLGPLPGDKEWATPERPEGAYITVQEQR